MRHSTCVEAREQLSGPGSPFTMVFRKGFPVLAVYVIEGSLWNPSGLQAFSSLSAWLADVASLQ